LTPAPLLHPLPEHADPTDDQEHQDADCVSGDVRAEVVQLKDR
jgi:hypothetical protein